MKNDALTCSESGTDRGGAFQYLPVQVNLYCSAARREDTPKRIWLLQTAKPSLNCTSDTSFISRGSAREGNISVAHKGAIKDMWIGAGGQTFKLVSF